MLNFKRFRYETAATQNSGSGGGGAGSSSNGTNGTNGANAARNGGLGGTGNPGAGTGQGAGNFISSSIKGTPTTAKQYSGGGGGASSSAGTDFATRSPGAQGYVLITYTAIAMNLSGPISLGGTGTTGDSVNLRLGNSATATITMNDAAVRTLTGTTAGTAIIMPTNFYGK